MKKKHLDIVFLDFDDIKNPLLGAGQAKATLEVGRRLVKKGHKVTIISSRYPGSQDRLENGMFYSHIGLGTKNIKFNNVMYILALPFHVRRIKADIIVECFTAPVSTLLSPLWTKIPVVAIPTSFEADRFSKLYHFPFELIERIGCKVYKYFLPYTSHFDKKMKKINPNIVSKIVPEGVGDEFFQLKKRTSKHILYLGRFDIGQKGIDLLLEAYAKVVEKIKYPLIVAGRGDDERKIKSLVSRLNINKYVTVQGPAFGREKNKLLSSSLFVAMPSRHEGFSLFSLEAMASGLPLVVFDIPGMSWITNGAALKAKPFDTALYSQLLLKAASKRVNQKLQKESRMYAQKYTWTNVVEQYEQFFSQIVNRVI